MPSSNWCGSNSINRRSLQVPGSLSSAFTMMYFGLGEVRGTKLHFKPGGKTRAAAAAQDSETFSSSMICFRPHLQRFFEGDVPFVGEIGIDRRRIRQTKALRDYLHFQRMRLVIRHAFWILPQCDQATGPVSPA